MVYGPCEGVAADGRCEVLPDPCPFVGLPTVRWSDDGGAGARGPAPRAVPERPAARRTRRRLARGGVITAEFPARPLEVESFDTCARILAGQLEAVLLGDGPDARVQFPPSYRARLAMERGLEPWCGINNRDRNRVGIEGELAALAALGAGAVLCITGDHPASGHRPDALPVFDLDATRTAALAARTGLVAAVAESPSAPPSPQRAGRLVEKLRAGAEICFVNHCGGVAPTRAFIGQVRQPTGDGPDPTCSFLPCIPVILGSGGAAGLGTFPAMALPPGYADAILAAADPRKAGIRAAVRLSLDMLALEGVQGVDLSGVPEAGAESAYCEAVAEIAQGIRRG